jgi:DNA-binding MarR family transcriptional regulator
MKERFGLVRADVMQDPEISLTAKGVYALLCTFADRDGMCFPTVAKLAECSGVSKRTIERAVGELQQKKYVKRERRKFFLRKDNE